MNWREVLANNLSYRDIENWPRVDIRSLPLQKRAGFHRNFSIVSNVLDSIPIKEIATRFQLSQAYISKLMSRCLLSKYDEVPPLTLALVPYNQVAQSTRQKSLPRMSHVSGTRNCFEKLLLMVPNLEQELDLMLTHRVKDKPNAQVISPGAFHSEFIRILEEADWPKDTYPYTSASWAYESARRYYHKRLNEIRLKEVTKRENHYHNFDLSHYALREVQIDEQKIDLKTGIHLELNDELIPLRLARVSLLLALDVDTDCYLGYHISYSGHPNQQDMLSLFRNILTPWHPLKISTEGISYVEGASFPSGPPYYHSNISFETVALDNALIHMANAVEDLVCNDLGCTLNLGIKMKPKRRNWIELAFQTVNRLSHRFVSTTGSHPQDPKRESLKNSKTPPSVNLRTFEEALSVILTNHNVCSQARLGAASPLETFHHHLSNQFLRMMPCSHDSQWSPLIARESKTVKFPNYETRAPYINFYGARYSGKVLSDPQWLNNQAEIEFDRYDIRKLRVFDKAGRYKGDIFAPSSWQRFPHSLHTRQLILRMVRQERMQGRDPLAEYFHGLLKGATSPKYALALTKFVQEANLFDSHAVSPLPSECIIEKNGMTPIESNLNISWTTGQAQHNA
jgi:hypothetical protein